MEVFRPATTLSFAALLLTGCTSRSTPPEPQAAPAVPVTIALAETRTVPVQLRVIGNVEPYSVISVKAQVGGELVKVFFTEGQTIRKGDQLFQIDARPYELALRNAEAALAKDLSVIRQAEAILARDLAQARQAEADATRSAQLAAQGIIARELDERARTNSAALREALAADRAIIESARTAVAADKVAIERARLDLSYCLVKSPIDGRTGPLLLNEGNLVKANADAPLVVIHQVQPVYVSFSIPEEQLGTIRAEMAVHSLQTEAAVPGAPATRGSVTFIDNAVDTATGTIKLKATFPNRDHRLWPGQFVDVTLNVSSLHDVTVVPAEAVQNGPHGRYVYVVKDDSRVEMRPITAGRSAGPMIVIDKGLAPGERVVTDGHLRLTPGAEVRVLTSTTQRRPAPAGGGAR